MTRKNPHALMVPPGIPEYFSRARHLRAGRTLVEGRAWSGFGPIERVEFSPDGAVLATGSIYLIADLVSEPGARKASAL